MSQEPRPTTTPAEPAEERNVLDQAKLIGALIAGLALILFFLQNLQEVKINFLWMDWNTQMIWALIVSALLGAIGVFLAMWFARRRGRKPKEPKA
jgi:uncharacterized integral membrane protein